MLFQDEAGFYRQPSQGWLWARRGPRQPRMHLSYRANTRMRVVGFMNALSGAVLAWHFPSVTVKRLCQCLAGVAKSYPAARRVYIVWDNWTNHRHPALTSFLKELPKLEVVFLPTYSPWLNPIEKLWRLLRQEVAHAHPFSDDFDGLKEAVRLKLAEYADGGDKILRYTGLQS